MSHLYRTPTCIYGILDVVFSIKTFDKKDYTFDFDMNLRWLVLCLLA